MVIISAWKMESCSVARSETKNSRLNGQWCRVFDIVEDTSMVTDFISESLVRLASDYDTRCNGVRPSMVSAANVGAEDMASVIPKQAIF